MITLVFYCSWCTRFSSSCWFDTAGIVGGSNVNNIVSTPFMSQYVNYSLDLWSSSDIGDTYWMVQVLLVLSISPVIGSTSNGPKAIPSDNISGCICM